MAATYYQRISKVCDELFYNPFNANWRFRRSPEQGQNVQDYLAIELRRHGLSPAFVNVSLAERGIEVSFQALVGRYSNLITRAIHGVNTMAGHPHHIVFSAEEKRDYILEAIVEGIPGPKELRFDDLRELLLLG